MRRLFNRLISIVPFLFLFLDVNCNSQLPSTLEKFPQDFKDQAYHHIQTVVHFGIRNVSSNAEEQTVLYIKDRFEEIGLSAIVEPFMFESFEIKSLRCTVGKVHYEPVMIGFNPYGGPTTFTGKAALINQKALNERYDALYIENRVVITDDVNNYFRLLPKNPAAVVILSNEDYEKVKKVNHFDIELHVTGDLKKFKSANVVGTLANPGSTNKEILVTAHLDAYKNSPGADDNGSGIGVLIELARYFHQFKDQLPMKIKFVAFGAEELGALGARVYLDTHKEELKNCLLVFNMDTIGGNRGIFVEMEKGQNSPSSIKCKSQFPEAIAFKPFEGIESHWRLIWPGILKPFMTTHVPPWLKAAIEQSTAELGYKVTATGPRGADQQIFAQAGIAATSIGIPGNEIHSPKDIPGQVNKDSLEKAGKIVASTILKAIDSHPSEI